MANISSNNNLYMTTSLNPVAREYGPVHTAGEPLSLTIDYPPKNIKLSTKAIGIDLIGEIKKEIKQIDKIPKKYIINENATICFWNDGTKTVSKRHEYDEFDKEIGFLFCCYQHYMKNWSRNKRKRFISWFKYEHVKEFLFDLFVDKTDFTIAQAKDYLDRLKVEPTKSNTNKLKINIKKTKVKRLKEVTE